MKQNDSIKEVICHDKVCCELCCKDVPKKHLFIYNDQHLCFDCLDYKIFSAAPTNCTLNIEFLGNAYSIVLRLQRKTYILYKDNTLYLLRENSFKQISINTAKDLESNVYYKEELYQARQDFQRGGTPREIAYSNHGFDSNGHRYFSAIDKFF